MSEPTSAKPSRSLRNHVAIHCLLMLLYFLPGGLLWNHVDPLVFGVPFGMIVTAAVLPLLIAVNMLVYVRSHWIDDGRVSAEPKRDATEREAERTPDDDVRIRSQQLIEAGMAHDKEAKDA